METMSDVQLKALQATAVISSSLSTIGSSLIIASIFNQHKKQNSMKMNTLHQLLLGLSMCDISCSLANSAIGVTNPKEFQDTLPWSRGNQLTCSAFAFLYVFATSASNFYNMFMSIHFYRIVKTSKKRSIAEQKRRDWWFLLGAHSVSNVIPLLLVISGLITNSFHPHDFLGMCFYSEYPHGCDKDPEVDCEGGEKAMLISRARTGAITFSALVSITATIMLAIHVRRNIQRSNRYSVPRRPQLHLSGEISTTSIRSSRSQVQGSQAQGAPTNINKQKEVAKQAVWYMLAFSNSFVFLIACSVVYHVENKGNSVIFATLILTFFFQPLQGALNFIVFIRPRYRAWEIYFGKQHKRDPENNPMMPFTVILKKAIQEQVPSGQQPRPQQHKLHHEDTDTNSSHPSGQHQKSTVQPHCQSLKYASDLSFSSNAGFRSSRYVPTTIPENLDLNDNGNVDDIVIEFKSNSFVEDESSFNDVDESQIFGIDPDDSSA